MKVHSNAILMILVSLVQLCCLEDASKASKKSLFQKVTEKNTLAKRTKYDDMKYFEGISENSPTASSSTSKLPVQVNKHSKFYKDESLAEIKTLLTRLLEKIDDIDNEVVSSKAQNQKELIGDAEYLDSSASQFPSVYSDLSEYTTMGTTPKLSLIQRIERRRRKKERKEEKRQRWGKWTNWSPCSVSCGKGREIRWRHCLENCDVAETEMEEKTCQLPACGPTKLFGVIKL